MPTPLGTFLLARYWNLSAQIIITGVAKEGLCILNIYHKSLIIETMEQTG